MQNQVTTVPPPGRQLPGGVYIGKLLRGVPHGEGEMIYSNGDRYTGRFQNSLRDGKGADVFANGDSYVGDHVRDKRDGSGEYIWSDGNRYSTYIPVHQYRTGRIESAA
jgi:hypothetical protein